MKEESVDGNKIIPTFGVTEHELNREWELAIREGTTNLMFQDWLDHKATFNLG